MLVNISIWVELKEFFPSVEKVDHDDKKAFRF